MSENYFLGLFMTLLSDIVFATLCYWTWFRGEQFQRSQIQLYGRPPIKMKRYEDWLRSPSYIRFWRVAFAFGFIVMLLISIRMIIEAFYILG